MRAYVLRIPGASGPPRPPRNEADVALRSRRAFHPVSGSRWSTAEIVDRPVPCLAIGLPGRALPRGPLVGQGASPEGMPSRRGLAVRPAWTAPVPRAVPVDRTRRAGKRPLHSVYQCGCRAREAGLVHHDQNSLCWTVGQSGASSTGVTGGPPNRCLTQPRHWQSGGRGAG